MIKRKIGVDDNWAFEESCKNNDILLTDIGSNLSPISYIDIKGQERLVSSPKHSQNVFNFNFDIGDLVRVYTKNNKRKGVFEGVVLRRRGSGVTETFTVKKSSTGVEKTWPICSPTVQKIEVIRHGKVSHAKSDYAKKQISKAAKVRELLR